MRIEAYSRRRNSRHRSRKLSLSSGVARKFVFQLAVEKVAPVRSGGASRRQAISREFLWWECLDAWLPSDRVVHQSRANLRAAPQPIEWPLFHRGRVLPWSHRHETSRRARRSTTEDATARLPQVPEPRDDQALRSQSREPEPSCTDRKVVRHNLFVLDSSGEKHQRRRSY
jgi:hypothetical protein